MRDIKFRAKDKITGKWVYGYYAKTVASTKITDCIIVADDNTVIRYEVDVNTLGQFIGLLDKYNVEIYDGDVVNGGLGWTIVKFGNIGYDGSHNGLTGFGFVDYDTKENQGGYQGFMELWYHDDCQDLKVVGNVYDEE